MLLEKLDLEDNEDKLLVDEELEVELLLDEDELLLDENDVEEELLLYFSELLDELYPKELLEDKELDVLELLDTFSKLSLEEVLVEVDEDEDELDSEDKSQSRYNNPSVKTPFHSTKPLRCPP
ncbi:MAG: hypothetical protein ACTSWQ_05835 [Candidatus Thorarchaeota archaeon]